MRILRLASILAIFSTLLLSAPAQAQDAATSSPSNNAVLDGVLALLQDAVITRLEARVSLESIDVRSGQAQLRGVKLENFHVGLRLKARNAQKLLETLHNSSDARGNEANQWRGLLAVLRLGLYDSIEVGVYLRELRVSRLDLDAEKLRVEGLHARAEAGSTPVSFDEGESTLGQVITVLRHAAVNRVSADVRLDELSADRLHLYLEGLNLHDFSVRLALLRSSSSRCAGNFQRRVSFEDDAGGVQ